MYERRKVKKKVRKELKGARREEDVGGESKKIKSDKVKNRGKEL